MIPRGVMWVGILAAIWTFVLWLPVALMFVVGAFLPDPGSIISLNVPVWVAIVAAAAEPLLLSLLWVAWYSRLALRLLTLYLTLIAAAAGLLTLYLIFWRGQVAHYVFGAALCWITPAAIYALLLYQYTGTTPED